MKICWCWPLLAKMGTLVLPVVLLLTTGCEKSDEDPGTELPGHYRITVYYTPVESFHDGPTESIRGCTTIGCESGQVPLGSYPASFIAAVRMEGSGRLTSGAYAGKYLNGSFGGGFWISDFAPDANRLPLRPFITAAADDNALPQGTRFKLRAPLQHSDGAPLDTAISKRLRSTTWEVQDHFEQGYGGELHIDLYIGEEDQTDFTSTSPYYFMLENVVIATY